MADPIPTMAPTTMTMNDRSSRHATASCDDYRLCWRVALMDTLPSPSLPL